MQKYVNTADSYRRENPENTLVKEKITSEKVEAEKNTFDKSDTAKDTPDQEEAKKGFFPAEHVRDANSRTIFGNHRLTCQFLRDYSDLPIFSDLQPEDIEDVTDRYRAFLGVEFEMDTVKKVRVRASGEEREVFVIPLIEHKTRVDYDVAMQLLRYMAVIWYDYRKRQESLRKGVSGQKSFRYPAIIPIVYYEGMAGWTAGMRLSDRIDTSAADGLAEYIPDFTYKVVQVHGYRNDELKKKHNEMSLLMMLNRIQSPEDYREFLKTSGEYAEEIYGEAPSDIRRVCRDVLWGLFQKMNVPVQEGQELLAKLEESGMGYLFADMEKMDIQAERRNTELARQEAEEAKQEANAAKQEARAAKLRLDDANQKLSVANQEANAAKQKLEETSGKLNTVFEQLVSICQGKHLSRDKAIVCLQERYGLKPADAVWAVKQFWKDS